MKPALVLLLLACCLAIFPSPAEAHEMRPALLQIERAGETCTVSWKQPRAPESEARLLLRLSPGWRPDTSAREVVTPGFRSRVWARSPCSVADVHALSVEIDGLAAVGRSVIVVVDDGRNGARQVVLSGNDARLVMASIWSRPSTWRGHVAAGVRHIARGIDHLAFILALALLCGRARRIVLAVTGFTVGHTLALFAVLLDLPLPNSAIVEFLVGLSIVFMAREALDRLRGRAGLAYRFPFLVAGLFGLVHGTAYSSALAPFGDSVSADAMMIGLFNIGIEIGQIAFLAAAFLAYDLLRRMDAPVRRAQPALLYAVGSLGAYLLTERLFELV